MSIILVRELVDAGVHFGHRISRWNPKMRPFIYSKRNLIHIINLRETVKGLIRAYRFLARVVAGGKQVLFVGTKRQARRVFQEEAKRCEMPFVVERWLGGTLTNFQTIRSRMHRLEQLEQMEADGSISQFSKKIIASLTRERRKIKRNLDGIRKMDKLPAALVVVDPRREHIAVAEANKLGIPVVAIIDTDSDPDLVDIPIPANDDSMRAIEILAHKLANAAREGQASRVTRVGKEEAAAERSRQAPEAPAPAEAPVPEPIPEPAPAPPPSEASQPAGAEAAVDGQGPSV